MSSHFHLSRYALAHRPEVLGCAACPAIVQILPRSSVVRRSGKFQAEGIGHCSNSLAFAAADDVPAGCVLRIQTMSERPIEVRAASVRRADWPRPIYPPGALGEDEGVEKDVEKKVYRKLVELAPLRGGERKVAIYENRLWRRGWSANMTYDATEAQVEQLKWIKSSDSETATPSLALKPEIWPANRLGVTFAATSLPAAVLYVGVLLGCRMARRRRERVETKRTPERLSS